MKPEELKALLEGKRRSMEPLPAEDLAKGFKGWYASKRLPHFDSPGTQQFITYRLADALPSERRHEWKALLAIQDDLEKQRKIERYLDQGQGQCQLRDQRIAELVQNNLWYQDGRRYRLLAWVVMPNHVHVVVEIWQTPMGRILQGWKGYTSNQANRLLGRRDAFWAPDYFDRYVRDAEHLGRIIGYIERNPVKAGLVSMAAQWQWSSARYRNEKEFGKRTLNHPTANRVQPE